MDSIKRLYIRYLLHYITVSKSNKKSGRNTSKPEKLVVTDKSRNLFNQVRLKHLLSIEKQNRGISKDKLLFVGTANIATYWWCAEKAYLNSRENELMFFFIYLEDRLKYSLELNLIKKVPTSEKEILSAGSDITSKDIENLLSKKSEQEDSVYFYTMSNRIRDTIDLSGKNKIIKRSKNSSNAINMNSRNAPLLQGKFDEKINAEKYPTIRWNFPLGEFVFIGIPDGITSEFVYEFKSTRNNFLKSFIKPVAETQADFYGKFFNRKEKRIQIHVLETNEVHTEQTSIDENRINNTLKGFTEIVNGSEAFPPKPWKCNACEYISLCPITPIKLRKH